MGKEMELPAWKLKAIERGAIPDPRIDAVQEKVPEKGKKKSATSSSGLVAVWVKPELCTKMQRLVMYLGMPPATGFGKVVEKLVMDRMEDFREIDEMIDRKIQGK